MTTRNDDISVAVRARPSLDGNHVNEWAIEDRVIYATRSYLMPFGFDHIFSQKKTNFDIYAEVVKPVVTSFVAGQHGTVLTFGEKFSGKTHTMMGHHQDPGVIRRAVPQIFSEISSFKTGIRKFVVRVGFLEIDNEGIRDLLLCAPDRRRRRGNHPSWTVAGSSPRIVTNVAQALAYIDEFGGFPCDERAHPLSSKLHSIFRVTIESSSRIPDEKSKERGNLRVSQLNFVDLVGTDGIAGTRHLGEGQICLFLTELGRVIRKLTTTLKKRSDSRRRVARMALLCHICPTEFESTLATLEFASGAKLVQRRPLIKQMLAGDYCALHGGIDRLLALISEIQIETSKKIAETTEVLEEVDELLGAMSRTAKGSPQKVLDRHSPPTTESPEDLADVLEDCHGNDETWALGLFRNSPPTCGGTGIVDEVLSYLRNFCSQTFNDDLLRASLRTLICSMVSLRRAERLLECAQQTRDDFESSDFEE
ncbi:kinesin-like protein KIN-7N [Galendromus occidentalis]|uniref:Kinesin-like protein KIN-7N n=1 Tax=Galendromus occidentalis TaxID=34638 RepID=A0AAJ6QSU6_9ACAR|nr:kinesin-like protein KIN-7N [Galendromus occidentalis]